MIMTIIKIFLLCLLCLSPALSQSSCETNRMNDVKNGKVKVRGTNLGSWLVLESGISTYLWTDNGCDRGKYPGSYLLEKCLGDKAQSVMEKHWSSWVTEDDFVEMSKRGVNVIRIPVGWWHIYDTQGGASNAHLDVSPTDFVVGGLKYLDKAFEWGKKHGIAIIVDLHAAPGSQNGKDHSAPAVDGQINWDKDDANPAQTVKSIELYAQRYSKEEALFGFALLNEPAYLDIGKMQDYYQKAYAAVRKHSSDSYVIINPLISPGETGLESHWTEFMNPDQGFSKVAMDLHYYSCFGGPQDTTDADKNINYIKYDRRSQIANYIKQNPKLLYIGEWSACQHGDANRSKEFLKAEIDTFSDATLGWTFWQWVGTNDPQWELHDVFILNWLDHFDQPC